MALNANALVTLDQTKTELDIPLANTDEDTRVENFINAASDHIETMANRVFRSQSYTHRFHGKGDNFVALREFPVTALTSVSIDDQWAWGTNLPAGDVAVEEGAILFKRCGFFTPGTRNVQVVYTAGYATIPSDIQQAAIEIVRYLYFSQNDRRSGVNSVSKLGETITYLEELPKLVELLVAPHTREAVLKRALEALGLPVPVLPGVADGRSALPPPQMGADTNG